jgi:phosphoribosyl 1,2-cyclic phosphodiesterase
MKESPGEVSIGKLCVLASSSAGNSVFISNGATRILIDAGLSRRELRLRLESIGEDLAQLDAILITHEHSDHVSGLPVLVKQCRAPVYLSLNTAPTIEWGGAQAEVRCFQAGSAFTVGGFEITSFTTPHDAVDPVGFTLESGGVKVGIATDLGYLPDSVKWHLRECRFLLLESNHDVKMLKVGPYPWAVKQRVLSRRGHLSNDHAADYIGAELPGEVETLVLGHLSENNNHPAIVEVTARQALDRRGRQPRLVVAEPRHRSEVFEW